MVFSLLVSASAIFSYFNRGIGMPDRFRDRYQNFFHLARRGGNSRS
jgi:hypothetical protein